MLKQNAKSISIVFDCYQSPSIKDSEHALRNTGEKQDYHITGEEQTRPIDFIKELRNIKFKEALVKFLIDYWETEEMAAFFSVKTVYINYDNCYKYNVKNGKVVRNIEQIFS